MYPTARSYSTSRFLHNPMDFLSFIFQDFDVFRAIDPREYIYDLWEFGLKFSENLKKFADVSTKFPSGALIPTQRAKQQFIFLTQE